MNLLTDPDVCQTPVRTVIGDKSYCGGRGPDTACCTHAY